ncbi:MAG TPA: SulP family inorganic anion transporter [Anaerolineae bacterium]|jgi:SulP family sulfate permease|nr:SulP family inorganic anion transporter [Anaerolineae bacterium]
MARQFINSRTLGQDITAGLVLGIQSVPDGLAQGLVAFVNPIYGLYGYMMGTFTGAFFTSSVFMVVQATGAMSLVVASVPQVHHPGTGDEALFTLAILTGLVMFLLGLFKLGSLIRFVPHAVMVGFVNAVALLIILGQLNDFFGHNPGGGNRITQTINHALNLNQSDLPTVMIGLTTIFLIITLERTRLGALGMVVAMMVASLLVPLFGWDSVAQLNDIAEAPGSLPRPVLPSLSLIPSLIIPAFSLAFVGLVQGASITQSYINPDGKYPDASGDFVGQGVANMFSGLFQGMPVGGSFSATSLAANAGARSRFANIFAGLTMAVVIVVFGSYIGHIAMPTMAGLLIVIGFRTFKPEQVKMVWKTGLVQRVVMGITFFFCLLMPLQFAVLVGVAMSLLLYVLQQSNQITIKQWKETEGPYPIEKDPPETLPANEVLVLLPYGSLFFAAAPLFEKQLPEITEETYNTVVVISLRGYEDLGSTFLTVLERYNEDLQDHHGKLMLAGISDSVVTQLEQTKLIKKIGRENIYVATEQIGQAGLAAWEAAEKWVDENRGQLVEVPTKPSD